MLHRSIRRAIEAKSDMVGAMIDKLNKPYEHLGWPGGDRMGADGPGDDRNGLVLLAIGLAMAGFGVIQGHEQMIRSEEHTSELQSLMRISYAVFCLKKKKKTKQ